MLVRNNNNNNSYNVLYFHDSNYYDLRKNNSKTIARNLAVNTAMVPVYRERCEQGDSQQAGRCEK